jgi:hypothetical protein
MRSMTEDRAGQVLDAAGFTAVLDDFLTRAVGADPGGSAGVRIDRIALLEQIRSVVTAAQNAELVEFAREQVAAQIAQVEADGLDPSAVGRGVGDQIALACRVSPHAGSRRLEVARALATDLPLTGALLAAGQISEHVAQVVVFRTNHLRGEWRRAVEKHIVDTGLVGLSPRQAEALAKRCAYEADPAGYAARGRAARADRRVGLRPAPDTMGVLSGLVPLEQGVACLAALRAHTDTVLAAGDDERTRDQIMADTLVERLTGQVAAADVNVEVGIVIPVDALLDPDQGRSAEIVGHGPIPAGIARDLLASTSGKRWWRRLFTAPSGGPLVGGDPRRRRFEGFLAELIRIRDHGRCRDPFCDAPIRHLDHIRPHRDGGPTSYANGRGVCARGNYVREMPGWRVEVVEDGLGLRPHTVRTTTPTGHSYLSGAGPAP